MLSSSTIVAPGRDRLLAPARRGRTRPRPCVPATRAGARCDRVGDAEAGEVVVLDQHEVGQRAAVVHAAPGAHRRLLDRAQPGQRLAGVPDPCRRSPAASTNRRVSVATPDRWHRKLSAVRSPVSTERKRPATPRRPWCRGRRRRRRRAASCTATAGSSCANTSVAHAVPASTPSARATTSAVALRVGGDERGGEVAERPEVLGERARAPAPARRATGASKSLMRPGPRPALTRRLVLGASGTNSGRRCAGEHEAAEELGRRAGMVDAGVRAPRFATRGRRAHERACSPRAGWRSRRRSGEHRRARRRRARGSSRSRSTPASRVMTRCSSSRIGGRRRRS